MISKNEFVALYNNVATRFQMMNNIALTAKCFQYVSDLPVQAVQEICEDFFDNARHAPLPGDFKKAAKEWKKNFYLKNGYWYGNQDITPTYRKIDCEFCNDGGIVRMVSLAGDSEKLIRCSCEAGLKNVVKIPQWSNDLRNGFKREHCPIEWFKPDVSPTESDKETYLKIWDKLQIWRGRISEAERHWKSLGYIESETK